MKTKSMSKYIIAAATAMFVIVQVSAFAKAEPNSPPAKNEPNATQAKTEQKSPAAADEIRRHIHERMQELGEKLNLTEEQKKSIRPIIEIEVKEIHSVRADESLTAEQKQEKIKAIRQSGKEQMSKMLTPEQQEKLKAIREGVRDEISERIRERMEELSAKLELTEKQKKAIKPIVENEAKEIQTVSTNENLVPEQKRAKVKAIRQSAEEQINKLLTPAQQEKLKKLKEETQQNKEKAGAGRPARRGERRRYRPGAAGSGY